MTEYHLVKQTPDSPYIIFDIDGTLANIGHRVHHIREDNSIDPQFKPHWGNFFDAMIDDVPNRHVTEIFNRMCKSRSQINNPSIIVTGRPETHRAQTQNWLMSYNLVPHYLFMRPANDYRSDVDIKKEIVEKYIQKAPVLFVVDDRDKVVELWRSLGYKCLQCQKGNY